MRDHGLRVRVNDHDHVRDHVCRPPDGAPLHDRGCSSHHAADSSELWNLARLKPIPKVRQETCLARFE